MTIISDATSLILLAKIDLLEKFVEDNEVIMPKLVYEEIIKGKDKGREDSMLVERLVTEKILLIKSPDNKFKEKLEKMFNLKGGELEVVSLAIGKTNVILSDDKKCINTAKTLKINFITSLDVVVALYKKCRISKEKALESLDGLSEYGWYAKDLVKNYREVIK